MVPAKLVWTRASVVRRAGALAAGAAAATALAACGAGGSGGATGGQRKEPVKLSLSTDWSTGHPRLAILRRDRRRSTPPAHAFLAVGRPPGASPEAGDSAAVRPRHGAYYGSDTSIW